jgi:HEAT repeat protein
MTPRSLLVPFLLFAVASGAAAGEGVEDRKEIKRLIIDVERIRRLEPKEQSKEVERLYRTLMPRVREMFRYALIQRKVDYNKGRDKQTPEAWVEKAWSMSPDAFEYLLWDTRAMGYVILDKNRSELRPLVLADLASKSEKDVKWALHVVSEVHGKEFFEPVLEVFEKNAVCSEAAIYALREIGDARAIAPLIKRHPDLVAVSEALRTLQRNRRAEPALVALLDAKDAEVRGRAAYGLAESGDPALVGHIDKLLRDDNPRVRQAAANMGLCLDKEAYPRVRPAIVALAKDPDPGVKKFVLMCLAYRHDAACGPALLEMARDTKLGQLEHYQVVRMIYELTYSEFGYDTSEMGWRPDTPKNQEALRRFAEWVEKNSGPEKPKFKGSRSGDS